MADWGKAQFEATRDQPAAPAGLQQVAGDAAAAGASNPWFGASYVNAAQEWYGGRNVLGENNGWDSGFMSAAFDYTAAKEQQAGQQGNPTVMWDMFDTTIKGNEKATGVATWDDPDGRWRTGDVFSNGEKLEGQNLYDTMDKDTANLLLSDFMLTADEKRRVFRDSDRISKLDREITQRAQDMTRASAGAREAYQFSKDTEATQAGLQEWNPGGASTALAGAGAGAAMGAIGGSIVPFVGTAVGAVGGAIIGGLGGWLNQDQITEQMARTKEIADRAYAKYDPIRGTLATMPSFGDTVLRFGSPFSNLYQGSVDLGGGKLGDGRSEFYEVDEFGQRKVSALAQGVDVVATLLDGITQFANPAGRAIYMTSMGITATGKFATPLTTGAVWNDRTASFDKLENPKEWAAAMLSAGIDVAQLGMGAAVVRASRAVSREGAALAAAQTTYNAEMGGMRFTVDKATNRATGVRKWTLSALAPSENIWQPAIRWKARTIALRDGGRAVTPDDLFQAAKTLTSSSSPWRGALVNGLAEGYEEAWQGILDPWSVSEKFTGSEVFVQAVYGFAGGLGMSVGSLMARTKEGIRAYEALPIQRVEREARFKYEWRAGTTLTDEEWAGIRDGMSDSELRRMALSDQKEAEEIGQMYRVMQDQLTIDNSRESVLGEAFARAATDLADAGLSAANPNNEEQLTVLGFENNTFLTKGGTERVWRANSAMFSAVELGRVLVKRAQAVRTQITEAAREVAQSKDALTAMQTALDTATSELADARQGNDAAVIEQAQARVDAAQNQVDKYTEAITTHTARGAEAEIRADVAEALSARYLALLQRLRETQSLDEAKDIVTRMNGLMVNAYDGKMGATDDQGNWVLDPPEAQAMWKKAATVVLGRHPFIDSGSFAGFIPQVSFNMTLENVHATVGVHQAMLKPMQADHDGDRKTTVNIAFLPDQTIRDLRRGVQQMSTTEVNGLSEFKHNIDDPDGEESRADVIAEELRKPMFSLQHITALRALDNIEDFVRRTFGTERNVWDPNLRRMVLRPNRGGFIPTEVLDPIISRYREGTTQGNPKARETLRNDLLRSGYAQQIAEGGDSEPMLLKLQQHISQQYWIFNRELAKLARTTKTATPAIDTRRPDDVQNQEARSRLAAVSASQTMAMMGSGDGTRDSQKLWYSALTRTLIQVVDDGGWTTETQRRLEQVFAAIKTGDLRTEGEIFIAKDAITDRVHSWLEGIARDIAISNGQVTGKPPAEIKVLISQMSVPSVMFNPETNGYEADLGSQTSLLQMLMRKSVEIEERILADVPLDDTRRARLKKLKGLTYSNKPHSYAAKSILAEVFRFTPLNQIAGEDAEYLGTNITMDQLEREVAGLHPVSRKNRVHRWKRSPAYMRAEHRGLGDPPYTFEQLSGTGPDLKVNAFTLLVDALETTVNVRESQLESSEKTSSEQFITGLRTLQTYMGAHLKQHEQRLRQETGAAKEIPPIAVLEDLIRSRPAIADMIVALMPGTEIDGAFEVIDGRVYAAPWVMNMLVEPDLNKAEKDYFVYKNLSSFNVLGGTVDLDQLDDKDLKPEDRAEALQNAMGTVTFDRIKSRFQQTIFFAAEDPTGVAMAQLIQIINESPDRATLLRRINSNPSLLRNRAPLMMYNDDVAQFESSPKDLWSMGLNGTQLREALGKWQSRLQTMSNADMQAWAMNAQDKIVLDAMRQYLLTNGAEDRHGAREKVALLRQARRNRQAFPDAIGPVARNQFLNMISNPFVPMQDKGKAPEVSRFGEGTATSFSWGVRQAWEQALDGVTALQWKDVLTNLTKLTEGPVQIMLPDGRTLLLDMTDDLTVINMLADERTSAFARAVMFGTVRDMDANNDLQHYNDTEHYGSITAQLEEQNNIHLVMDSPDSSVALRRAHTGIGLVESGLIKDAMSKPTPKEQGKAFFPILRAQGEILTAYTTRVDAERVDTEAMQRRLTREIWAAMLELAALSPEERSYARAVIASAMRGRITGRDVMQELVDSVQGDPTKQLPLQGLKIQMEIYADQQVQGLRDQRQQVDTELQTLEALPSRTQDQQDRLEFLDRKLTLIRTQIQEKEAAFEALRRGDFSLLPSDFLDVDRAIDMYQMKPNDPDGNYTRRLKIRNLLEQGNNKERFRNKGVPLILLDKLASITHENLHELHDPNKFTEADWQQLGFWAATVHITEQGERSGAQSLLSLGEQGDPVNRFYDRTFDYLMDPLFDDAVLDKTNELMSATGAPLPKKDAEKVAKNILTGILSEKRLGPWNSVIVTESVKVADLISRSPVGIAVAMAGNQPKRQRAQMGTSTISLTPPEPEHFSTMAFRSDAPTDEILLMKVDNHFYSAVELVVEDASGNQRIVDITKRVGVPSPREGARDDLRIFRSSNWRRLHESMLAAGEVVPGERLTLQITYVDPDKKPFLPQYVNSLYFDGAGRDEEIRGANSLVAASVFGTNGWSKVGQQLVLDAAAKGGSAGFPTPSIPYATVEAILQSGEPYRDMIRRMALLLVKKQYNDMDRMAREDLPALEKMLKQRYVVVGTTAEGNQTIHWIDEIAGLEARNEPLPFDPATAKLVGLSEEIASTLLSEEGMVGKANLVNRVRLNPQDMWVMPSLDADRLASLGITGLGETVQWNDANSPLMSVASLPQASLSAQRGDINARTYQERRKKWEIQATKVHEAFTPAEIAAWNERTDRRLEEVVRLLGVESLSRLFRRMGVPADALFNTDAALTNLLVRAQLDRALGDQMSGRRMFEYVIGTAGDLAEGILAKVHIENDFEAAGDRPAVFGDLVRIDLDQFRDVYGNQEDEAFNELQQVISIFARRGIRIFLTSENMSANLKERVADWMERGDLGYEAVHESTSIYVPITDDGTRGRTLRALESTLTEIKPVHPRGIVGRLLSNAFGSIGANENTVLVDTDYDGVAQFQRMAQVLIPGDLTLANDQTTISLNYPSSNSGIRGRTDQIALLQRDLLPLLEDDAAFDKLLGKTNDDRDPKKAEARDIPIYNETQFAGDKTLLEPGVMSVQSARQQLIDSLRAGKLPTVADTIWPGQFLLQVSGDTQNVFISRVGYQLPDAEEITRQWAEPVSEESTLRVAMARNKLNDAQTVPPPMKITEEPIYTAHGMMLVGEFDHHRWGKWIDSALGFKAGVIKLSMLKFMGPMSSNGWRPSELGSLTAQSGKRATENMVNNFRDLFLLTGFDARDVLVDVFFGEDASRSRQDYDAKWDSLKIVLNRWSEMDHGLSAGHIDRMMNLDQVDLAFNELIDLAGKFIPNFQMANPTEEAFLRDPKTRLASLITMSLMAPGIRPEHVVSVPGLLTTDNINSTDNQIIFMPPLLTKAMQSPYTPELTDLLIGMANQHSPKDQQGRPLYWFDKGFNLHVQLETDKGEVTEFTTRLQLVHPIPATEDLNAYADANLKAKRDESAHIAGVMAGAIDARTVTEKDPMERVNERLGQNKIMRFRETDREDASADLWRMLTRIKPRESQPRRLGPLQWTYLNDSLDDVNRFSMMFDKEEWDSDDAARVFDLQTKLLNLLGLTEHRDNNRAEVDYLVRQFYGTPGPTAEQKPTFRESVTAKDYAEAVNIMLYLVENGRNPLEMSKVPIPHEAFWRKVFEAGTWAPSLGKDRVASTWDEYVYALFGQLEKSKEGIDSRFRRPIDGFFHTYVGTIENMEHLPVSMDEDLNSKLLDPTVNEHFVSIDPGVNELLANPIVLPEMRKTISNLIGVTEDTNPMDAPLIDSSSIIAHRERVDAWAKSKKMAPQVQADFTEYLTVGVEYIDKVGRTHAIMHGLVNLSVINRLFNFGLMVSAVLEVPARTALESFTDLVLGNQIRTGGLAASKMGTAAGEKLGVKWRPKYSPEEVQELRKLARQLAANPTFMEYLYKELMYTHLVEPGRGKIGEALEKGATKVARMFSDPRWGMPSHSIAELYLGAVLETFAFEQAEVPVKSLVQKMEQDPLYLVKDSANQQGFTAHKAGLNRVAQARALKPSVVSKTIMTPINAMTEGTLGWNFLGHLLKLPFQFTTFQANAFLTMTGLGGVDQLMAMMLQGRDTPGFINRMGALVRGQKPLKDNQFDMSDVLEGIDLSRTFIRGGITQTGLFAAAMLAQHYGLGGEDEEMRKRRRLAEYLGTPLFLDPREMQNDFLYADAIFLDQIPVFGTIFEDEDTGRSVVVPHWIIRQFTSPMMGVMRFLDTGDPMDIGRGFQDAFSVIPNSILRLWKEAELTAELLFDQAAEEDYEGNTVQEQANVTKLLLSAASVYEKALIENSFINSILNGADHYNRNPWLVPATNETGDIIMREGYNNMPMRSEALTTYVDEEGNVKQAYDTRSGMDAQAHAYAENNHTFAVLASLFTGQAPWNSTFQRKNMVVAEKKITLPEVDQTKIEALLMSAYLGQGGQQELTLDETIRVVKARFEANNVYWDQTEVEQIAQAEFDARNSAGRVGGLTVLDEDGRELITKDGARGVYTSLSKGLIDFSSGTLAGLWIDMDMRKKIEEEWATDLIQEGIDLGLGQQAAEYRMRRIMRGDFNDPDAPALRKLLYSDKIPYSGDVRYNQLNMTFMIGPDGKPWATPFQRQNVAGALGIPVPQTVQPAPEGMTKDSRGKLVDEVFGINLGWHGLERQLEEPPEMPDESALDAAAAKTYTPSTGASYGAYRRSGYGGGGYSSSSYGPPFQRMYGLPENRGGARPDETPFINANNPIIRRARVNTQRIFTERGRLKQWQ